MAARPPCRSLPRRGGSGDPATRRGTHSTHGELFASFGLHISAALIRTCPCAGSAFIVAVSWRRCREGGGACRWLVGKGLDVNSTTHDGTSGFHWAVWQGHMHVCKWMVYLGGCDFASTNSFGCNAIQWAAQTDDLAMCRWLSAIGLDVRVVNSNGHSALHKAASKGRRAVCAWLLNEEGLREEHMRADGDGNTPAVMARLEGFVGLAAELEAAERVLAAGGAEAARQGPFGRGGAGGDDAGEPGGGSVVGARWDVETCTRLARLRQMSGEVRGQRCGVTGMHAP